MVDVDTDSAVEISVPGLVRLQSLAGGLHLKPARVRAAEGGDYLSARKGRGMEYSESRPYAVGDDIRNLDWRVMARSGKPHTKLFREERERPVLFWVDFRAAMFFATRGCYKSVLAARLASLLAWSVSAHSDRVGGLLFSDRVHHEFKPRRGKRGVLQMIRALVEQHRLQRQRTDDPLLLTRALLRLRRVVKPGSLVFLLSDFRGMDDSARAQLLQISRRAEVVILFIYDPLERDLPAGGRYRVSDGEHERILDTADQKLVQAYHRQFEQRLETTRQLAARCGARFIEAGTAAGLTSIAQQVQLYRN